MARKLLALGSLLLSFSNSGLGKPLPVSQNDLADCLSLGNEGLNILTIKDAEKRVADEVLKKLSALSSNRTLDYSIIVHEINLALAIDFKSMTMDQKFVLIKYLIKISQSITFMCTSMLGDGGVTVVVGGNEMICLFCETFTEMEFQVLIELLPDLDLSLIILDKNIK